MEKIMYRPIGYIHSPFKTTAEIPRQSIYASDREAIIDIKPEFSAGLLNLDQSSHIVVLFHFHQSSAYELLVEPRDGSSEERGVFATRSPHRPNGIGLSIVELVRVQGNHIIIKGVDMLDGTPVLDIKPYSPGLNPEIDN